MEEAGKIAEKVWKLLQKRLRMASFASLIGALIALAISMCSISLNIDGHKINMVKINNKTVGYVKEDKVLKAALDRIKETDGKEPLEYINVTKVRLDNAEFLNQEQIENIARKELGLKVNGIRLSVNGEILGGLLSQADAENVISMLKEKNKPALQNAEVEILGTTITDEVKFISDMIEPEELYAAEELVNKLMEGKGEKKTYTVVQGDTIWDIAAKNNVLIEDIRNNNSDLNIDKIKIGQEIKIAVTVPYVHVETMARVKQQEAIPYESSTVNDSTLKSGKKSIKQGGKNGIADVEKEIKVVNGNIVDEKVLKSVVLQKPVNEIVAVGTKRTYYVASNRGYVGSIESTGRFGWPSRGVITSYYGYRWGKLHAALDIASQTGSPIYASDSGVVILAGWNGSYGKCVIIAHENGYQTLYGHCSRIYVSSGQRVSKGQKIAAVGSTGFSTGPHVHFEIRKNGVQQNPLRYLN